MTIEGLGEIFEGDFEDMCAKVFPLLSMGGQATPSNVGGRGKWTPIGVSGNFDYFISLISFLFVWS